VEWFWTRGYLSLLLCVWIWLVDLYLSIFPACISRLVLGFVSIVSLSVSLSSPFFASSIHVLIPLSFILFLSRLPSSPFFSVTYFSGSLLVFRRLPSSHEVCHAVAVSLSCPCISPVVFLPFGVDESAGMCCRVFRSGERSDWSLV
jgi:hypothetical protein